MIIEKLKKAIVGTLTLMSIFALTPMAAHAEWKRDNVGWWYTYSPSSSAYYCNDWLMENGKWYYFNDKGYIVTGWKEVAGRWYYFNTDGSMAKDTYVGNYYVNHDGVWGQDNNKNQINTSNDASTSNETSTDSQGISVTYPSNWTKMVEKDGRTAYNLNNGGEIVQVHSVSMGGHSQQDFLQGNVAVLKSTLNVECKVSNQLINSKTADVIDYVQSAGGQTMLMHYVILYNNNTAYLFLLVQSDPPSSSNLDSFNRMLDTVKFK